MSLEASARFGHSSSVNTVGDLIHNEQALNQLRARGVGKARDGFDCPRGTLIIRAHGVPLEEYRNLSELKALGKIRLFNGTCPEVTKVQAYIKRYSRKGHPIIILGDIKHPEVIAHISYAQQAIVISTMEEVQKLPPTQLDSAVVLAQTTFKKHTFSEITTWLCARHPKLIVHNTICPDTWKRQAEAFALIQATDAVVIVGGKSSNNTRHLTEIAQAHQKPTQQVETASELCFDHLEADSRVAVLSGASTPRWTVEEVVAALETHGDPAGLCKTLKRLSQAFQVPYALCLGLISSFLFLGLHAPSPRLGGILIATYLLGIQAWIPYIDACGLEVKGLARGKLLKKYDKSAKIIASIFLLVALACSKAFGLHVSLGLLIILAIGTAFMQHRKGPGFFNRLHHLPGVRDLAQAMLPAILVIALPGALPQGILYAGFACFSSALAYHINRHIADLQRDQILGRDLLPIAIGLEASRWVSRTGVALAIMLTGLLAWHPF